MSKLTADQRRDLMEVIDDRHQRCSALRANQVPEERWHEYLIDSTYADSVLDRVVHNAYRIALPAVSMRQHQERLSTTSNGNTNNDLPTDVFPNAQVIGS